MSLFLFLTVVQAVIAAGLVGLVLIQRSEGGGLGIGGGGGGGGPGGLMSARGAADFLTRLTKWLAVLFVALAIILAAMAVDFGTGREIDNTLDRSVLPALSDDPISGGATAPAETPAIQAPQESDDPLADVAR